MSILSVSWVWVITLKEMRKMSKKYFKIIVIGLSLVLLVAFSGGYGYKYIRKEEKTYQTRISTLEREKKDLKTRLENLDIKEKNYYDEYVYEYNRRVRAERALSNIDTLTFERKYLDSLAEYIRYQRDNL